MLSVDSGPTWRICLLLLVALVAVTVKCRVAAPSAARVHGAACHHTEFTRRIHGIVTWYRKGTDHG